ncbi:MAG: response regulator transcription factor [Oscillospiraceae bacterium]|nr:response regulator transcription factor [Oscillospiraceae bacterium]
MSKQTVLLIEDNEKLNEINRRALVGKGYEVMTALSLAAARERLSQTEPDVILLDVVLPDGFGFDFCEEIRGKTDAHIIFLTSRRSHDDKLKGLSLGGDDYVTKPFKIDELILRVASAMRRRVNETRKRRSGTEFGNLTLDSLTGRAYIDSIDIMLTKTEFAMLNVFAQNEGKIISAELVYEKVWKQPLLGDTRSLRKRVSDMRGKLNSYNCTHNINNIYGVGYCFEKQTAKESGGETV